MKYLVLSLFLCFARAFSAGPAPLDEPYNGGSLIASQFSEDEYKDQDKFQLIVSGKFMLSDVHIAADGIVQGFFCEFSFDQQKEDPSLAPRLVDLYGASRQCQEHTVSFNLHQVANACRKQDVKKSAVTHSVPPSAVIFHQPKSGASLLTNMIASSNSGTRVISEPSALHNILTCQQCDEELRKKALEDAVYLLGRTTQEENYLYLTFSPASTVGLPLVRDTFPDARWIFVTRDADTVLQKLMDSKTDRRNCGTKKRRNPGAAVTNFLLAKGKNVNALETDEQACAAFMATNMEAVVNELSNNDDSGRIVEYEELLDKDSIIELFKYLGIQSPDWEKVEYQRTKRSNSGRGQKWTGEEDTSVSNEVQSATAEFELKA
jgi:hypothetical protein